MTEEEKRMRAEAWKSLQEAIGISRAMAAEAVTLRPGSPRERQLAAAVSELGGMMKVCADCLDMSERDLQQLIYQTKGRPN